MRLDSQDRIIKYPRTPHLQGSRLQPGDEDLSQIPFAALVGRPLVVEEKIDGANTAISFTPAGEMRLQSRGHFLRGGWRERHYDLFKQWAGAHRAALWEALGSRYILYGEWMWAKHSVFYDALPHYFFAFDLLDRESGAFLDTPSRLRLTEGLPLCHVPVLYSGSVTREEQLLCLLTHSRFITENARARLGEAAAAAGLDPEKVIAESDTGGLMEGLYIKVEEDGRVTERLKYVRAGFAQVVEQSDEHWLERPMIPNGLSVPLESLFQP